MKKQLIIFVLISIINSTTSKAQNVNIPDANFKAALLVNLTINTNADTEIQLSEASSYTDGILVAGHGISDLTGIETFTGLSSLNCYDNLLTSINISSNTALISLNCGSNQLTSLDLSNNIILSELNCGYNLLTSLDLSYNTVLTYLHCSSNQLINLNLPINNSLYFLNCSNNNFTSLDISNNTGISMLSCGSNYLGNLDVSMLTNLVDFYCSYNLLNNLSLTNNINLSTLYCNNNLLTTLDLTTLTNLTDLVCNENSLTRINIKNGTNTSINQFFASANPSLTCIEVDNEEYSSSNWPNIDPASSFSVNCDLLSIDNSSLDSKILIYPNPATNSVFLSNNYNITLTDLFEKIIDQKQNTNFIDITNHPAGMYFILLSDNNGQIIQRNNIVKE